MTARLYHSPSSTELGRRCPRAHWYRYTLKIETPKLVWSEALADALPPGVKPKQRSAALGVAMHEVGEAYFEGRPIDWGTYPAKVFQSGTYLLPHPEACAVAEVEASIGDVPLPPNDDPDKPSTAFAWGGVLWAGYRDLITVIREPSEAARLELPHDTIIQWDYKSTADIARYAKTRSQLEADLQANLYGLEACERFGLSEIVSRWVYFETKRRRLAVPVDFVIRKAQAAAIVEAAAKYNIALDSIPDIDHAEPNPDACPDFGGCEYHVSAGGPCPAKRSIGRLIALRTEKRKTMALTPEQQAKFEEMKNKVRGNAAPATTPAQPPAAAADPGPAPSEQPKHRGPGRPRVAKPTAPPAPPPATTEAAPVEQAPRFGDVTTAPSGGLGETLAELAAELSAAETSVAQAQAEADAALARVLEAQAMVEALKARMVEALAS